MLEATERLMVSNDWITIVLLMILGILIYNKIRHPDRFNRLQSLLLNNSYINSYAKANPIVFNKFNILFYVILILILSLFFFNVSIWFSQEALIRPGFTFFLKILLAITIFVCLRVLVGIILGLLFETEREQQHFSFLKISYLSNFSVIIFPLLVIGFYIDSGIYNKGLILFGLILFIVYYLLFIKNNSKLIIRQLFYFILYLCALEIAPFVIIYKLIIDGVI